MINIFHSPKTVISLMNRTDKIKEHTLELLVMLFWCKFENYDDGDELPILNDLREIGIHFENECMVLKFTFVGGSGLAYRPSLEVSYWYDAEVDEFNMSSANWSAFRDEQAPIEQQAGFLAAVNRHLWLVTGGIHRV